MTSRQGVTCSRCGASTPLPDDLRQPSFACAFCHGELRTADYAGHDAVSADALVGHLRSALANPGALDVSAVVRSAPRFEDANALLRPTACQRCQAPVEVPLDLHVHQFVCRGCQSVQQVSEYISDRERLDLDMARQIAGNEAYKRLLAEGVHCGRCGGRNAVPDDGSVQLVCSFCGAAVLLGEHVDPGAVARHRLKHSAFAMRDEAMRAQAERIRKNNRRIGIVVAVIVLAVLAVTLLGPRLLR